MNEKYICGYDSPIGKMTMESGGERLSGLYFANMNPTVGYTVKNDLPIFVQTQKWLNTFFSGKIPDFTPPLEICGSDFFVTVSHILLTIPFGTTVSYKDTAKKAAEAMGKAGMSAQAVGGAVGRNRIAIIVPCHRVIGSDGSLTGYAYGVDKKEKLLKIEGAFTERQHHIKKFSP